MRTSTTIPLSNALTFVLTLVFIMLALLRPAMAAQQARGELTVAGTRFVRDGEHFPFTGISFFNAIYNPTFNRSSEERRRWLEKFRRYGISVLRVWAQWDSKRGFVDTSPESTL